MRCEGYSGSVDLEFRLNNEFFKIEIKANFKTWNPEF